MCIFGMLWFIEGQRSFLLGKSSSPEALGSLESTHELNCFKAAHMQVKHMHQKYFHT